MRPAVVREMLAEFLGTFVLIVFGVGVVAQTVLSKGSAGTTLSINIAWGLAVTMGCYVAGGVTGAHLNPAVTVALAVHRRFPWSKVAPYVAAQFAGAFAASAVVFATYHEALSTFDGGVRQILGPLGTAGIWATYPQPFLSTFPGGFIDQIVGTALLVGVILAITDTRNSPAPNGLAPVIVGLLVVLIGATFGFNSGYAINPARDLGPRLFTAVAGWGSDVFRAGNAWWWVPVVAPCVGGVAGGWVYKLVYRQSVSGSRRRNRQELTPRTLPRGIAFALDAPRRSRTAESHMKNSSLVCRVLFAVVVLCTVCPRTWVRAGGPAVPGGFDDKTAKFSLQLNNETAAYRERSAFLLPGATLDVQVLRAPAGEYTLSAAEGTVARRALRHWVWRAPMRPGLYELTVDGPASHEDQKITVQAFVMVPASDVRGGVLNGYRIGSYPSRPLNGNSIYRAPAGFIEVTRDNDDTKLSPHFRLKQFLCKQEPVNSFPKYAVLHERLILNLELILAHANAMGFDVDTLSVMSAYRTPYYNHAIGDVEYSMHQWGRAADIFIDRHGKGVMEDVNHDRTVDRRDAQALADEIDKLLALPSLKQYAGGLGVYPPTAAHPPFVHIDVRGTRARWQG